ncbi:Acyl-CoA oxidase [Zostera marina]|uniref:Acyl-CoA oxidase n=1 Tax=Zostera marina TaxID=29655 RepID=A0A0K9P0B3_ZOSMR|nr:Acyl-CoA oxidase [Zostera marina]
MLWHISTDPSNSSAVAGELPKQYQKKLKGGTFSLTWNYLKDSMGSYLSQPNPVTSRWEGEEHFRDPKFQLNAFRYRTSRLLQTVAVRLNIYSKTLGNFGARNRCSNHLLTLAESHIETIILERFIEAIKKKLISIILRIYSNLVIFCFDYSCPDRSTSVVLKLVCYLFALDRIWNDIGTYHDVDYVVPNKAKAIHKLTEYLCFEMRGVAKEFIDAFDLSDTATRAPIYLRSQAYYTQLVGF